MKRYAFIVLNLEKFWNRLCSQNRAGKANHAFVRRGTVGPKDAKQLFFYVTSPRKEICGYADFVERKVGNAKELWKKLSHESLLSSYEEYQDFLQGRQQATFIRFKNLRELPLPITTEVMSQVVGIERMPQMGLYITDKMVHKLLLEGGSKIG